MGEFRRRLLMNKVSKTYNIIEFADSTIKSTVVARYGGVSGGSSPNSQWINNTKITGVEGEITYEQAAAVITFDCAWRSNNNVISFDEFQYFINCTTISGSTFYGCQNLLSVIFPTLVKKMPYEMFRNCKKLTTLNSENLVTLDNNTCFGAGLIYFPMDNLKNMGISDTTNTWSGNFRDCTNLDRVIMPKIEQIRSCTFYNCAKIRYVVISAPAIPRLVTSIAFNKTNYKIYVLDSLVEDYKIASEWSNLASRILSLNQFRTDFPNESQHDYDLIFGT